ncbi:TetR/AcrR family transcriptional regulator [Spongiactinospora sp. TRM90649]|uniref:TetR/AcrR family transcriptional regulator n=1 Tax=Spongiactinospora sp. TRM90649 TaxID=3031114 RepID=UPI003211C008
MLWPIATGVPSAGPGPDLTLRKRKKRRTRQALVETALALSTERGFDGVTLDELCEAVDVSKGRPGGSRGAGSACHDARVPAVPSHRPQGVSGATEVARPPVAGRPKYPPGAT